MMRGIAPRGRSYGPKPRTFAERRAGLALELYGCTDAALEGVSVNQLALRHGLSAKEVEHELAIARQRRA